MAFLSGVTATIFQRNLLPWRTKSSDVKTYNDTRSIRLIDLPQELLHEIFSPLPQPWQGCFALSCKKLYQHLQHVFKEPMFQFPHSDELGHPVNNEIRECFLKKLQSPRSYSSSRRWTYCDGCVKLHPWNEPNISYNPRL